MTDQIEKTIALKASVSRVWRALTDHREFGTWFGVKLDGPFALGKTSRGQMAKGDCGNDGVRWEAVVQKMEPERLFAFTWHPYAVDRTKDYSAEPSTLVEFTLERIEMGTLLRVVESGFDKLPAHRRTEAFPKHENGWEIQLQNVAKHLENADAA